MISPRVLIGIYVDNLGIIRRNRKTRPSIISFAMGWTRMHWSECYERRT